MRDDRTSSDLLYEDGQQANAYSDQQPFAESPYSQSPLDTSAAGFKKVHARGSYGPARNAGAAGRQGRPAARGASDNPAAKALGAAGNVAAGALGTAKDAVVGAVGGIAGRIADRVRPNVEAAQLSEEDYAGVGDPCRVCGNPVAPTQERCPHCGSFRKPLWQYPAFIAATVATLALVVLFSILLNSCSQPSVPTAGDQPQQGDAQVEGGDGTQDADGSQTVASDAKIGLAAAIATAQSTYDTQVNQRTYTIYSVAKLGRALDGANAVYVDPNASDEAALGATKTLNDAITDLAIMPGGEGYSTPAYTDLVGDLNFYFESLVVMSGTVQTVSTEGDVTTVAMAINGDPNSMLSLKYRSTELFSDAPVAGNELLFYGTVSGTAPYTNGNGETVDIPAVTADYVVLL